MKIAVIFLLLGISSFIETSNGLVSKLNLLEEDKAQYYVRCLELAMKKVEILKKCPEYERKTREMCLMEDLIHIMKMLAVDLKCTVEDIFELLELPLNALELLKLGEITSLLNVINVDTFLFRITRLLEAVLAQINILLKGQLITLCKLLGSTLNLVVLPLHDNLGAVTTSLVGTLLGTVTRLVAAPVEIAESLLGSLGSIG
ncbi:uncharacterized protein [Aquarana catesbeiana]|uniref:uncharacterized protein n=1 Tax=Aquarana catesbeiana TaxID=8400 RepID=UPI003CC9A73A